MATIEIHIGSVVGSASLGNLPDSVIGPKLKTAMVGMGAATSENTNQEMADKLAVFLRGKLRIAIRDWYSNTERNQFERAVQTAGDAYLDTEAAP